MSNGRRGKTPWVVFSRWEAHKTVEEVIHLEKKRAKRRAKNKVGRKSKARNR